MVMLCRVQTVRTWLRDVTVSSSRYRRYSIIAWTSCWSASRDRYDCGRLGRPPGPSTASPASALSVAGRAPTPTPTRRSAASSAPPSPPSENCSDVAGPSRPRPVTTSSYRERNTIHGRDGTTRYAYLRAISSVCPFVFRWSV